MAAPNIVNVTSIYGKTMGVGLSTNTSATVLTCGANKVLKLNSIIVANTNGVLNAGVTVGFYDSSATSTYKLAETITVPADSTIVILGKDSPIYLEESDQIRAGCATTVTADLVVSYEEIDDA